MFLPGEPGNFNIIFFFLLELVLGHEDMSQSWLEGRG